MGGGGNVWLSSSVWPLWVATACGLTMLGTRAVQWISGDQDIRFYHKHRKADCADSDFLEEQGKAYHNHFVRRFFEDRFHRGSEFGRLFPVANEVDSEE